MRELVTRLKPHPLNTEVYGSDSLTAGFLDSIKRLGVLTPLSILEDGTIISGHRRWRAAVKLGLAEVPVRVQSFEDELAVERAIIESNRQREKTFSQKMREAEELERIERELAEQRRREKISQYRKTGETCDDSHTSKPKRTTDAVAEAVGIGSGRQYSRAKKVWEAAKSGNDKAQELVEKLDNEETTISAACNEIKQQEKMEVHYSSETPEWGTPQKIIKRVISVFGKIDLDPCSDGVTVPAATHYTVKDDGLSLDWGGRVYMNPPYGREIADWTEYLCDQYECGNIQEAIALVPSRTDTKWFRGLKHYPRCFIWGRLHFSGCKNAAPFPSMVVYLGPNSRAFCQAFGDIGDVYEIVST